MVEMRRCALSYEHVGHVCEPSGHDVNWPLLFVGGLFLARGLSVVATVPFEERLLAAVPCRVSLCTRRSTVGFVVILSSGCDAWFDGLAERARYRCMHAFFMLLSFCCCLLLEMCFAEEKQKIYPISAAWPYQPSGVVQICRCCFLRRG